MIRSFRDAATDDLFYGRSTKAARKALPQRLWAQAGKKLDALDSAEVLEDLRIPPGNRLEPISHLVSGWLAASAGPAVCPLFLSISVPRLGAAALHGTIACPATGRDMSSGTSLGASGCSAVGRPASNLSHLFPHRPSYRSHQTCRRPLPPNWAPRSAAHTCGVERC